MSKINTDSNPRSDSFRANYFRSYTDHMWRFYVRFMDGNTPDISDVDRTNWLACHAVYLRLRPEWQSVVSLFYHRRDPDTPTIDDFCHAHSMTRATVWKIIHAVQNMTAEERGLIAKRKTVSEFVHHGKQNDKPDDKPNDKPNDKLNDTTNRTR